MILNKAMAIESREKMKCSLQSNQVHGDQEYFENMPFQKQMCGPNYLYHWVNSWLISPRWWSFLKLNQSGLTRVYVIEECHLLVNLIKSIFNWKNLRTHALQTRKIQSLRKHFSAKSLIKLMHTFDVHYLFLNELDY